MNPRDGAPQDFLFLLHSWQIVFGNFVAFAASVGNVNCAQIYNSSAAIWTSPVRIDVALGTAGDILISRHDTQLATDNGIGVPLAAGGPAGVNHVRSSQPAANVGTAVKRLSLPAGQSVLVCNPYEYMLNQNKGLVIQSVTANVSMLVAFSWAEFEG